MSDDEDLLVEDESLRDLSVLRTRDSTSRKRFLESLGKIINVWTNRGEDNADNDGKKALMELLPSILMLSLRCPFPDVREKCSKLIENVKLKGLRVPRPLFKGPSCFIPSKEIPPIGTDDEQIHNLHEECFLASGRVSSVTAVMTIHSQYLELFSRTEFFLMRGEGPLPFEWRHYIAIMVNMYKTEFLRFNGNKKWLKGLEHIPKKLQRLSEINKYLAHQPWLIDPNHIEQLLKGEDNWSLSELVQAIVIIAHFHSLSSFVFGCGLVSEIDLESGHTFRPPSLSDSNQTSFDSTAANNSTIYNRSCMTGDELMERMKEVLAEQNSGMEASQEELFQHFEKLESGELAHSNNDRAAHQDSPLSNMACYVNDPNFQYSDFASRDETAISTFRIGDCSWEEHGFSLINRLYPDIGTLLDEKFNTSVELTYCTLGDKTNVDTSVFRIATWNYIHLIFGIYHDDYLYTEVNKLMERSYKRYIKTVATHPGKTIQMDYMEFMPQLTHSERVHINLLLLEARLQAELLYAVRAILKYMR